MIEAAIFVIVFTWAVKKAAEYASEHWQSAKAANRKATKGKPVSKRAASAVQHDVGYWASQVLNGFPQVRHGLAMGWNTGRAAQHEGWAARAEAKSGNMQARARAAQAVREQRRRQAEILEEIRAARQAEPEPEPEAEPGSGDQPDRTHCAMCRRPLPDGYDGGLCPQCRAFMHGHPAPQETTSPPATTPTEGNTMSSGPSDGATYTQQMHELQEIRRDAEAEVNDIRRKQMMNRVDALAALCLDKDTLTEAAAIDDALREQEKAAQATLDATDAAIAGLRQRHGGIQEAVSDSPVDQPAQPEFYQE